MKYRQAIYLYLFIALLTSVVIYVVFKPITEGLESALIKDAVISGFILSGLLFLLKNIVKYSHFSQFQLRQRLINHSALAILFVVCWIGLEYGTLYVLLPNEWDSFLPTIGVRIVFAFLIYTFAVLIDTKIYTPSAIDLEEEREETPEEIKLGKPSANIEKVGFIAVKNGQKIDVVLISEIIYLQAEGDYVMIHSTKGKFLKEQTMKSFESMLPADKFVRVHRSSIVNIGYIAQIELYDKQSQLLKLKNGGQVRISLSGYKTLKKILGL
ncbi:MAG: LytTR family transcriptional regulator DNA-binding domain-containing protein [Prevotella sp.]|jgi:hypothetical protein|nr:LytTR family transcriptional regulator DNA-binding domain-containing protein [Prevotella sp.]